MAKLLIHSVIIWERTKEQNKISALKTNSGTCRMVISGIPLASIVPQPHTVSLTMTVLKSLLS